MRKWYELSYKSLRKTVIFLQKKRQEKEVELYDWMKQRPFNYAIKNIKRLFDENRHLKLHRNRAFRAWYKHEIDFMLEHPDIYHLSLAGGYEYRKEDDPMYDRNAPDWEQFDRENHEKQVNPVEIVLP